MRPLPFDRLASTMERLDSTNGGPDLAMWESVVTAYRKKVDGYAPPPGANQRTEAARARLAIVRGTRTVVDLYVDPICPYTWVAACWLREVGRLRAVDVRHHVMSLHLLNAGGVLEKRYAGMVGPSRVAMAVAQHHGREALREWHARVRSQDLRPLAIPVTQGVPRRHDRRAGRDGLAGRSGGRRGVRRVRRRAPPQHGRGDPPRRTRRRHTGRPCRRSRLLRPDPQRGPPRGRSPPPLRRRAAPGREPRLLRDEAHPHLSPRRLVPAGPRRRRRAQP